ncbi:NAD(P)-dependent alcohol dehydrogenase [Alkalicoccus halolimnae]|uniref:NAD(P)-dependent alcohol dehydrogenase n=1 Tax=Alkalicoccus halolimnae TaxID=1667239 RepID=A0AAJ8LWS1_9BACI
MTEAKMKAVVCREYGGPEVLEVKEVDKPVPEDHEVLIKIHATVAAPADCAFRKGEPAMTKIFTGMKKPKHIPGSEISGVIEEVGKEVKLFKKGDEVYGSTGTEFGSNAEYITLYEGSALALKPKNVTFGEAVAVSEGALTALPFLRDKGKIKSGQRVLINGAAGGVGSYAVQLAKYFGAEVTGVCSEANRERVTALGADHVVDYKAEDFTKLEKKYDIIFDVVGKSSFSNAKPALKPYGIYLSTVPTPLLIQQTFWSSRFGNKRAVVSATGLRSPHKKKLDLLFIKDLVESGELKPVIDREMLLEQIAEAHSYVETGHKKGSLVIKIAD